MKKSKLIFTLALIIVIIPPLGFPRQWETVSIVLIAFLIAVLALFPDDKVFFTSRHVTDGIQKIRSLSISRTDNSQENEQ